MKNGESGSDNQPVILIVDDNPQNLQVLGKQLRDKKYKIEFAVDGESALEWIKIKKFDLILLDINMPGLSGFEVCEKIRQNNNYNRVPVIFLSADTDRESILTGFEKGAQDYITKPFDSRELLVRVRTHLLLKESLEELEILNKTLEDRISERTKQLKEANEKLEFLNDKLLGLDKAKSGFLNMISHEIRTPLNGIMGPIQILKESSLNEEIDELVEVLDLSVTRLEKFSLEALLITRLQAIEGDIVKMKIPVIQLIEAVVDDFKERYDKKQLKIIRNFSETPEFITGEKELVRKAVSNILENAIIVSSPGGLISLKTYTNPDRYIIEIKDGGPGFPVDVLNNYKELFLNINKFRDNSKGIGLPMVSLIMEAHRGEIEISNCSKGGACVRLHFLTETL